MDSGKSWTPEAGTPQGAVLSPMLSNIYLDPLDQAMAAAGIEMVRYADDFVILCWSQREAEYALEQVRQWTVPAGLVLHPVKKIIKPARELRDRDLEEVNECAARCPKRGRKASTVSAVNLTRHHRRSSRLRC